MKRVSFLTAVIMSVAMSSVSAHASVSIPKCWADEVQSVEDGQYIVGIEAKDLTGTQLVAVLDLMSSRYTKVDSFPLIFGSHLYVVVKAVDYGYGAAKLSREQLKKEVGSQLQVLVNTGAVSSVECNGNAIRPFPGSTVHN